MHWCTIEWVEYKNNKLVVNLNTLCESSAIEFTLLALKFS